MVYQVTIIGGGLAGLCLAIDLKSRGISVIVFEKGDYPRQKVCGEYISMESFNYLHSLCPTLKEINLPKISSFELTSTGKKQISIPLDLGGFGVSRYLLEELLFNQALHIGVVFELNSKASNISYNEKEEIYSIKSNKLIVNSQFICDATGRKSNFENEETKSKKKKTNYIGVKYHIKLKRDHSKIEIHNFPGGYCGISNIEDGKSCLCYIVNKEKLKVSENSIKKMEEKFLFQNKRLKEIFQTSEFLFNEPITISGINFLIKKTNNKNIFYLGDSAGSIAPITGNGMSIAMRSSHFLSISLERYFKNEITKTQLINDYQFSWKSQFSTRIKMSRFFQKLSEYSLLTNFSINVLKVFPNILKLIIKQTHGKPF